MKNYKAIGMVSSYLFAIVAANLAVTTYGPSALLFTALILIPFDMIARDQLQEIWSGNHLKIKMFFLILAGGIISYLMNSSSLNVATASSVTFLIAGTADFLVYSIIVSSIFRRMIYSNVVSTIIDSMIFQIIAFGTFSGILSIQQSLLKIIGSIFWAWVFVKFFKK